jgi:uncharacterized protein YndB with AHSA1/START domain
VATAESPLVESVWIDADPDRVFPFFTDPARLTQWLGEAAELDAVPGGRFAVDISHRLVRGSYLEVQPPRRVVFSWGDAGSVALPPGSSRVEVDLEPNAGGTKVTLRHHGLSGEERADHARGWPVKLAQLVAAN